MSYRVVQGDILSQRTDAVAISIEIDFSPSEMPSCLAVAAAGGDGLRRAIRALRFVSVGRAAEADAASLPFSRLIVTAAPVWLTGKANELLVLHYCYQSIFDLAEDSGCRSIAMPFFPRSITAFRRKRPSRSPCARQRTVLSTSSLLPTHRSCIPSAKGRTVSRCSAGISAITATTRSLS